MKNLIVLAIAASLLGCVQQAGSFCEIYSPTPLNDDEIAVLRRTTKERIASNNEHWLRHCPKK